MSLKDMLFLQELRSIGVTKLVTQGRAMGFYGDYQLDELESLLEEHDLYDSSSLNRQLHRYSEFSELSIITGLPFEWQYRIVDL